MRYVIEHESQLAFVHPVVEHHCEVRIIPLDHAVQRVYASSMEVEPSVQLFSYIDAYGNQVQHFSVIAPHDSLRTRSRIEVEALLSNPFDYTPVAPEREREWVAEALRAQPRLWDFVMHRSRATPAIDTLAADVELPVYDQKRPLIDSVLAARDWIAATLSYDREVAHEETTLQQILAAGTGTARDSAHLLIAVVRSWGFAARYVRGYQNATEDEGALDPDHAWAEVLIPGAGWRGFDAVTGLLANDSYVAVAVGRDANDTVAQRGSFKGVSEEDAPPQVVLRMAPQQQ